MSLPWTSRLDACEGCPVNLKHLGARSSNFDATIALAGNPNTGKSTLFNLLTGLKQHVGNWPGKTVLRAEGGLGYGGKQLQIVDLPGTYSLLAYSPEEEIARNFILFGGAAVTIVVVDATALERNLNLVLQILQITANVVVALNLMDEARRRGIQVDHRQLARELSVPVIPIVARTGEGVGYLLNAVQDLLAGTVRLKARIVPFMSELEVAVADLSQHLKRHNPQLSNARWLALRLLDGDPEVRDSVLTGEGVASSASQPWVLAEADSARAGSLIRRAENHRSKLGPDYKDGLVESLFNEAQSIATKVVQRGDEGPHSFQAGLDKLVTSPFWGLVIMLMGLALIFWLTIIGANYPSQLLFTGLFKVNDWGVAVFEMLNAPWWLTGFIWDGIYRGLAWVVAVMLPPMAIFFPIFTFLEDLGYLPRIAFNLDWLFHKAGAHGKQALTMAMGFGCNAAGVTATRIIESPRERLIAILTNNFVPCNGRWPTLIMVATVMVAASFPASLTSFMAAAAVIAVTLIGIFFTVLTSWLLSKTVLKGTPSAFVLELPPYRRPNVWRIIYTSFIDRTLFVLWRAIVMAAPAGGLIWLLANISVGGQQLSLRLQQWLEPFGWAVGLDGAILLAYIVAIPANEIVIPTLMMIYTGAGMMVDVDVLQDLNSLLVSGAGWTLLTAANVMLFSVLHNPCSTTIWTIWSETRSLKWTALATVMPLAIAFVTIAALTWTVRCVALLP